MDKKYNITGLISLNNEKPWNPQRILKIMHFLRVIKGLNYSPKIRGHTRKTVSTCMTAALLCQHRQREGWREEHRRGSWSVSLWSWCRDFTLMYRPPKSSKYPSLLHSFISFLKMWFYYYYFFFLSALVSSFIWLPNSGGGSRDCLL